MLHIILLILKIIGIVLLCLLGILLLALCSVLFVPVRYRIEITRKEGENQPPVVVRVKITWLLHFLNILIRYPAEVMVRVRIMIFTILKMPSEKGETKQEAKQEKNLPKSKKSAVRKGKKTEDENKAAILKTEKQPSDQEVELQTEGDVPKSDKTPSFMDKLRALPEIIKKIIHKIKSLFENIQYTIQRLCDKMKSISDTIQYYKDVVESDIFQRSFRLCKGELTAILKSLKPQKFEAKLIVGMDDPAATGKILSICGMLYPVLGGQVDVVGDFERKRIEGRVYIKGRIRFWTFLRVAVRIYFNQDIKKLLKLLKKEAV
ncbi:MAG: hypothetical protein HFI62_11920 [Lachnospiraceae bacterium]|nr:hypothetical protein [Lachnospiraceae bacterium]